MNLPLRQRDTVCWLTASPLWTLGLDDGGAAPPRFRAPVLLRFKGDNFMTQASDILAGDPAGLAGFVARAETWRAERAGWLANDSGAPVTLYHPVHNRFYLVAANLVCRRAGLPDRKVAVAERESVSFVIRRLLPRPGFALDATEPATYREAGWVGDAQAGRWVAIDRPIQVAAAEERLPLFPMPFADGDQPRRLHTGLVPVARGAIYAGATEDSRVPAAAAVGDPLGDARVGALVEGALGGLTELARLVNAPTNSPPSDVAADQRRQAQAALALAMLDLAEHLQRENPALVQALRGQTVTLGTGEPALRSRLQGVGFAGGATAAQMVVRVLDRGDALSAGDIDDTLTAQIFGLNPGMTSIGQFATSLLGLPTLQSLLTAALVDQRRAALRDLAAGWLARVADWDAATASTQAVAELLLILLELEEFLGRELPEVAAGIPGGSTSRTADDALLARFGATLAGSLTWGAALADARAQAADVYAGRVGTTLLARQRPAPAALAAAAQAFLPTLAPLAAASFVTRPLPSAPPAAGETAAPVPPVYVIRCVYERPACAGIHPPEVSAPTGPFRLAGFFDADAPTRRLRIELPGDTSVADFRNAPKGVAIRLSKELRKQISRVGSATLDEPLDEQIGGGSSFNLGVICSLSIPIITICALILLLIVVQLLNIVFWWLPYFRICFPVRTG